MSTIRLALFSMRPEWEADRSMRWIEEEEIDNGRGRRSERIDEPFLISFKEEEERERDVWMIHNNKKKCFTSDGASGRIYVLNRIRFNFIFFCFHFILKPKQWINQTTTKKWRSIFWNWFCFCFVLFVDQFQIFFHREKKNFPSNRYDMLRFSYERRIWQISNEEIEQWNRNERNTSGF